MENITFTIGRDGENGNLLLRLDLKRYKSIGAKDSLPKCVSRNHCKISLDFESGLASIVNSGTNGTYINNIRYEKIANVDFVNSEIVLGKDGYKLDTALIAREIHAMLAKSSGGDASTLNKPLDMSEYDIYLEAHLKRKRTSDRITAFAILAISVIFVLGRFLGNILYVLIIPPLAYRIYYFFQSETIYNRYKKTFVCPNCGRFLGEFDHVDNFIAYKSCKHCNRKFKH